jgi:hypothetical protein
MKLILSSVILGVALANACDAIRGKSDLLRVGVAVYWCVVTVYWAWNVIERWIA